jgi:hypothetical protein
MSPRMRCCVRVCVGGDGMSDIGKDRGVDDECGSGQAGEGRGRTCLVVDVFLDAGEEREEQGQLDVLVAMDGGGEGPGWGGMGWERGVMRIYKTFQKAIHACNNKINPSMRLYVLCIYIYIHIHGLRVERGTHCKRISEVLGAAAMRWMLALSSSVMCSIENMSSRLCT